MAAKRNVPQLRFPGFTDDWEQRKLGEITDSYSGGTPSVGKSEYYGGSIPFIRSAEINSDVTELFLTEEGLRNSSAKMVKKGDILYALYGATSGEVGLARLDGAINQAILDIKPHEGFDARYIMQWLRKSKESIIGTYLQGGQGNLSGTIVNSLMMDCPCYNEQKKIGGFFEMRDEAITLHQHKLDAVTQYKAGMLQKMFPRDGEKVPKVRFPGFTGDWEPRKLGDICQRVVRKNKNAESDLPLTISSQDGLIDQRNFFGKVIAAKDMSNYYLLKNGEFAYNKSYSKGYDYGSIKRLSAYEQGCLSTLYICFALSDATVDTDYLEHYFDTLLWYKDIAQICAEGARNHGLLNVDTKAFFNSTIINIPSSLDEQKKIASFLDALDRAISLHQQRVDQIKLYKQGLLQQMFV